MPCYCSGVQPYLVEYFLYDSRRQAGIAVEKGFVDSDTGMTELKALPGISALLGAHCGNFLLSRTLVLVDFRCTRLCISLESVRLAQILEENKHPASAKAGRLDAKQNLRQRARYLQTQAMMWTLATWKASPGWSCSIQVVDVMQYTPHGDIRVAQEQDEFQLYNHTH